MREENNFEDRERSRRGKSRRRTSDTTITKWEDPTEGSTPVSAAEQENGRRKKKKHPILILLLLLLIAAGIFIGIKFVKRQTGYYTVAVFGVDSRNGNVGKGALSDVNIIARVDMETGEIKLVSLYRDTYSRISEDGDYHKFNEAYARGGPEQAVWALEHNTDVKVDDYATFNWKAVVDAINILGGIDLEITDAEFKYINSFITETVNSTGVGSYQLEHAGANHLDGVQAVAYARLRLMDTDFNRTERQRKVVALAFEKAKKADFATLNNILVTVFPQISTSVGISDIMPFAKDISKYYLGETAGFPFDKQTMNVGKMSCVIPVTWATNDAALHQFLYPDETYIPSALAEEISAHVANKTGLGATGETSVTVDDLSKNTVGSGQAGAGGQAEPAAAAPDAQTEQETAAETIEEIFDPGETEEETSEAEESQESGEESEAETQEKEESVETGAVPPDAAGGPGGGEQAVESGNSGENYISADGPGSIPGSPDSSTEENAGPGGN